MSVELKNNFAGGVETGHRAANTCTLLYVETTKVKCDAQAKRCQN
jgi:hypothetical protein